ncbi:MAG: stage III sporulation protein AF [Ruminococcus sp.]|nr:stage III sporulation protein AF [Ruminococcus sp.]
MGALVELIKQIGIFMVAAQAVIHFAPEAKYRKYIKLLVSIMILLQFLSPVYRIFTGLETDWNDALSESGVNYPTEEIEMGGSAADALVASMENEIKSRLNDEIANKEDYHIVNVRVSLETTQEKNENGLKEYELNNIRVVVMFHTAAADMGIWDTERAQDRTGSDEAYGKNGESGNKEIKKIHIEKISTGEQQTETDTRSEEGSGQTESILRKRFAQILGIEEEYMEVSIYGSVEETVE